jgi:translation initiation factor 2 subunit 2
MLLNPKSYKQEKSDFNMGDYEKLLNKAYEKVKRVETSKGRFEISKIQGHFSGKKTILTNFSQITSNLRRSPEHFQKYLLKELVVSGKKDGDRLVLNRKIIRERINKKIKDYVGEFVLCKECKKPDTEIVREGRLTFLHCLACGAKHPINQ